MLSLGHLSRYSACCDVRGAEDDARVSEVTLYDRKRGTFLLFLSALVQYRPGLLCLLFVLMLSRSLSEGATFILLVPLLGLTTEANSAARIPDGFGWLQAILPAQPPIAFVLALFLGVIMLRAALGY